MKITIEFNKHKDSDKPKKALSYIPIDYYHKPMVLPMVTEFYQSDAVDHLVPQSSLDQTFQAVADPDNHMITGYLIKDKEEIAGFFYLTFFYCCEVGGMCVMLEEIFIKEEHQGKGIGTKALEWILKSYPTAKRFRLEVSDNNDGAISLYESLGFQELEYKQMILDK